MIGAAIFTAFFTGCGPEMHAFINNTSDAQVTVDVSLDPHRVNVDGDVKPGDRYSLGWPECETRWLIMWQGSNAPFFRQHVTLCPADEITVDEDLEVTFSCGDVSLRERPDDC